MSCLDKIHVDLEMQPIVRVNAPMPETVIEHALTFLPPVGVLVEHSLDRNRSEVTIQLT